MKAGAKRNYEIRVVGEIRPSRGPMEQVLFPEGRCHSYLLLTEDGQPQQKLNFLARDAAGKTRRPFGDFTNLLGTAFNAAGREQQFLNLVTRMGLTDRLLYIKASAKKPARQAPTEKRISFGKVRGTPEHILAVWNRACAVALEINRSNIPFTIGLDSGRGPATCHAGIKTVLNALGPEFAPAVRALGSRAGRDLTLEARIDALRFPETRSVSVLALKAAQKQLAARLKETGTARPWRTLSSPDLL